MTGAFLGATLVGLAGFGVGWFVGRALGLGRSRYGVAFGVMLIAFGLGLAPETRFWGAFEPASLPVDDQALDVAGSHEADPAASLSFVLNRRSLGVDSAAFRRRFNQRLQADFPELASRLTLPELVVETGVFGDAFRCSIAPEILLSGGINARTKHLDEITLTASSRLPPSAVREAQAIAVVATSAVIDVDPPADAEVSALFIEATLRPDALAERYLGDFRLTATMDSMVGFVFTLSRPVESLNGDGLEAVWDAVF